MGELKQHALADAPSAYLRSASRKPVEWLPWSPEAFSRAEAENKPVLVDVGAVWCRWCDTMARESYAAPDVAALLNEHFIAIKLDGEERPDLDTRLQAAVSAISGQSGWPLTVLLTPDGKPFFGGTYFPAEERYGQPGFLRVLRVMANAFYEQRGEVDETASSVMDAVQQSECYAGAAVSLRDTGAAAELQGRLVATILQQVDPQHGGFGAQPKFLHPSALELLLHVADVGGPQALPAGRAVLATLHGMARGGIFDQLEGGFHRYSTDTRWIVPRFEKTLYDNAALLTVYARAARQFDDEECRATALAILRWLDSTLCDQDSGGFVASQAAAARLDANDSYYTWSHQAAAAVLSADELRLAEAYFDLGAVGDLPDAPTENVLFRPLPLVDAAWQAGLSMERAEQVLSSVVDTLRASRQQRPAPAVDRSMYTGWNSMAISACVHAASALQQPAALQFARRSLDRVLSAACNQGDVRHVVAYDGARQAATPVRGTLEDHALLALACLDVSEATGEHRYLRHAEQIVTVLLRDFQDSESGGFFDRPSTATDTHGILAIRRKPIQDAQTAAGNSATAILLLRLAGSGAGELYHEPAMRTLECFAGVADHLGLSGASYGLALGHLAAQ